MDLYLQIVLAILAVFCGCSAIAFATVTIRVYVHGKRTGSKYFHMGLVKPLREPPCQRPWQE